MSKKILSFALAVVMLVSVFAFSASATTFPETGEIGYRVVTDAYVGMPAGSTVTAKVFFVFPEGYDFVSDRLAVGNTVLAYNSEYFTYKYTSTTADGRTWGASYVDFFKPESTTTLKTKDENGFFKTLMNNKNLTENDKAKNFDTGLLVSQAYKSDYQATGTSSGHQADPYCELFSVQFNVNKTLTADSVIAIPETSANVANNTVQKWFNAETGKGVNYAKGKYVLDEANAYAAYVSVNEAADLKIRNNATDTNKVDLGITGEFKNVSFPVEFGANGTTCTNLSKIGVEVRMNGVIRTADCDGDLNYIYPTADGYKFRAAVTGVDASGLDSKVEVRVYMVTDNGTYYSNWMGCTARTAYTNAVAGGMSAIA